MMVLLALRQDWLPDRALYTRLSALIRGESARPRDHCYPDILRGKKKIEKSGESAVYIRRGMRKKKGRTGGMCWVDSTAWYPRAIRRNSATRLSDPHDLTHTEGATAL